MRYKMFPIMAFAALVAVFGCSSGQDYSDAVEINNKFVDAMGSYIEDIDKAESASDVADAIDAYAQKIDDLAPQMKSIASQHPEWKDMGKVPEELKPIQEKAKQMASQIPNTFMKTMKYMTDTQVREAHKRLQESMAKMR
jgi:K+/H+ antiporter YhaU regulatory subunit KhtT